MVSISIMHAKLLKLTDKQKHTRVVLFPSQFVAKS